MFTHYNPCSKMWASLASNQIIFHKLFKWLKLIELFMAMVLGNVEDNRCFFILSFAKSKLKKLIYHTSRLDSANVCTQKNII